MDRKKLIWMGVLVGSTIGSLIPSLWGAGMFSFSSVILSGVGGFLGIWFGVKFGD